MAQKTLIVLEDDLDGTPIGEGEGETVSFALDGTNYEIDLTNKNADTLRGILFDYAAKGRKVKGSKPAKKAASKDDPKVIREWAKEKGLDVPDRGRIPATVMTMWNER